MPDERLKFSDDAILRQAERGGIAKHSMLPDPASRLLDPNWVPDPERHLNRDLHQMVAPDFAGYPCPPAAKFLWLASRRAPCAPPWRVRVTAKCCATYSMTLIARALAPHATIITTPDGRSPAPQHYPALGNDIEFDNRDNAVPINSDYDPAGILWTPPQRTR